MALSLAEKKIVVGVTGGIAAYKSCELVRELKRQAADVRVAMTPAANEFVAPLSFATLSGHPVITDLFPQGSRAEIEHIDLSRWADGIVICPVTANTLAALAHGFADDPVSATVRAARVPVVLCPAMNSAMWEDPLVQRNVLVLREAGYSLVEPEFGALASASEGEGWGRLADLEHILAEVRAALHVEKPLAGKKVLVTASRTEEYIDPVRMITNPATGRMGFACAEAARALGARVTLIAGPTSLSPSPRVDFVPVVSAAEMAAAVQRHYPHTDILIMAAAVADYRPHSVAPDKIKKTGNRLTLQLDRTADILEMVATQKRRAVHIGFALETTDELANAKEKLQRKRLDIIVVNNPRITGAGFAAGTNRVALLDRNGKVEELGLMAKLDVACVILERAQHFMPAEGALRPTRARIEKKSAASEKGRADGRTVRRR